MATSRTCKDVFNARTSCTGKQIRTRLLAPRNDRQVSAGGPSGSRPATLGARITTVASALSASSEHSVTPVVGKSRKGRRVALSPFDVALQFIPVDNTVFFTFPGDLSASVLKDALTTVCNKSIIQVIVVCNHLGS
eukprot:26107-Prorocentrum_minimum.AAC.3